MYYILSQIIYKKNRVKESKLNVYFYFLIKGAFYGTVICGMRNLRVWYGPLPELVCIAQAKMTQAVLTFAVVGLVMVIITKFVFICVWRSIRSMDDNLLKRIALNEMILLCFLHSWCWPQSNSAGSEVCTITLNKLLLVEMLIFENCLIIFNKIFWWVILVNPTVFSESLSWNIWWWDGGNHWSWLPHCCWSNFLHWTFNN